MKKTHILFAAFIGALALFAPGLSLAQAVDSVGSVAVNIADNNTSQFFDLLAGFSYVCGAWFAFKSAMLLRDHTDNPQQIKLSKPLTYLVVCAILFSMPSFLQTMFETFFGQNGVVTAITTQGAGATPQSQDATLATMFVALSYSLPGIIKLVGIMARMGGIFLLMKSVFMLPNLEQGRETAGKVIWTMIAGVGLLAFPGMAETIGSTMGAAYGNGAKNPLTANYATDRPFNRTSRSIDLSNRLRTPSEPWISRPCGRFTMKKRRKHNP